MDRESMEHIRNIQKMVSDSLECKRIYCTHRTRTAGYKKGHSENMKEILEIKHLIAKAKSSTKE